MSRLKKNVFLSICFIVFWQTASAQLIIGGEIGISRNYLSNNLSNRPFSQNKPLNGYSLSFNGQWRFNDNIRLESLIGISSKNYRLERTSFFNGIQSSVYNYYLSIPIILRIELPIIHRVSGFLNLGISNSFLAYRYINADLANILAPKEYLSQNSYDNLFQLVSKQSIKQEYELSNNDKRYEIGLVTGGGLTFRTSKSLEVFSRVLFNNAWSNQQKKDQRDQEAKKNNTFNFSVGILHHLYN